MFALDDTIVACATAAGRGGLGVVRISGPSAVSIAASVLDRRQPLEPRLATFARLRPSPSGTADEVVATLFPSPRSYTGQDVVEISAHGSPVVLDGIIGAAVAAGARLAKPGEFTLRAFLNGKRDLVQAEAVGDLVDAATPLQARVAFDQLDGTLTRAITALDESLFELMARLEASLDFPDEGYHFITPQEVGKQIDDVAAGVGELLASGAHGRLIREGATVVIAGRTNVGKSSVFNALVGTERAIVTDVAGTTRDLVSERVDVLGVPVTLVDTAGARQTDDPVEREGVARGARARGVASLVVVVLDGSEPITDDDTRILQETSRADRLVVSNKRDRPSWSAARHQPAVGDGTSLIELSAVDGTGLMELRRAILAGLTGGAEPRRDSVAISNRRHIALMEQARQHLRTASAAAARETPEEFLLTDLLAARHCFDEVVGTRTPDDVLAQIFERFCIGK